MFGIKNSTLIRTAINLGVAVSTYGISSAIIKNNTADPETLAQKAALATGSFVIGSMVAEQATSWTDLQLRSFLGAAEEAWNTETSTDPDPS